MPTVDELVSRRDFGLRVRQLRKARNLTAQQVATAIGCSKPHIFNIESGRSSASEAARRAMADLFGISVDELAS